MADNYEYSVFISNALIYIKADAYKLPQTTISSNIIELVLIKERYNNYSVKKIASIKIHSLYSPLEVTTSPFLSKAAQHIEFSWPYTNYKSI